MKSNLFLGLAAASLMFTACSSDEILENVKDQNAIAFTATSELTSRSADSYCNTNLPEQFTVLAKYNADNSIYFEPQTATKNGSAWNLAATSYWPEANLDFAAWVNNDAAVYDYNGGQPKFTGFAPKATAQEQLDFIYAVTLNKNQELVKLNFRHALSQIVFRADNKSGLTINIKGVKVGKAHSTGDFTLPALATDKNYTNHEYEGDKVTLENQGTWAGVQESALVDYSVAFDAAAIGEDIVWLTDVNHKKGGDLSMILLPQTTEAWNPEVKGEDFNGSYFALDVEMVNKDGKAIYTGLACVPVAINWEQGVRYIYTFHFTDGGNGGYTPTPDDPKPVLGGITFDVETDDFIPAGNTDKDMNTNAKEITVKFNVPVLGIEETKTVKENISVKFTAPAYDAEKMAKEGYTFVGWAEAEDAEVATIEAGAEIVLGATKAEVTLYPVYTKDIVKLETTLSIAAIEHTETLEVAEGEKAEFTIPATVPTKEGYTFQGWATSENGEVAYQPNGKVSIAAGETVALFPVFTQDKVAYTVTLDFNGYVDNENIVLKTNEVLPGEMGTVTAPVFDNYVEKKNEEGLNYRLLGWSETKVAYNAGNKSMIKYTHGDPIKVKENTTLYAIYIKTTSTGTGDGQGDGSDI